MSGLVAMALGCLLVVGCAAATVALLRLRGWMDRCITGYVVATVAVVVAVVIVGVPGHLRPAPLLAVQTVETLVPVGLLLRRGWGRVRPATGWPEVLPPVALVRELLRTPWESALLVLAALALAWELVVALVLPPYAYDALSYHLLDVASWVQQASLAPPPLDTCCAYYPGNAELLSAWSAVLLHADLLVGTVQVVAAAVGGLAVAGIGRTAGLDRRAVAAAGALFVLTPALLAQAPTSYVDVLQTTLVLCGLDGLVRYATRAGARQLLVPALCTGLLSGTKGNGLIWAAALGLTAVVISLVHVRRRRLGGSQAIHALAGGVVSCLLLGGWWYLRNAATTGNPLYPFELRLGHRVLLAGPFRVGEVLTVPPVGTGRPWPVAVLHSWAADLLPWRHGSYDYQQRSGGLGPLWSWLGVLVAPVAVGLWRRRNPALVALVPLMVVFVVQPYPWWARFTLPLAAMNALSVVTVIGWLQRSFARRALELVALFLALMGALLVVAEVDPAAQAQPLPAGRVLGLVGAPAPERTLGRLFLPEYRFLDSVPASATVVVDVDAPDVRFLYPMFGRRFTRTVIAWRSGTVPDGAWVVSSPGRPLDAQIVRRRATPVSDVRGVRVWAPSG